MNRILQFYILFIFLISLNCREDYKPKLDEAEKILVVDALLTDESNVITVKLNYAVPFLDQTYLPAQQAVVVVGDDTGRKFDFIEKSAGIYESKAFAYEYGRTYTLVIKTKESKLYKSSPQTLFAKSDLEPVKPVFQSKTMLKQYGSEKILTTIPGLEFSTLLNFNSVSSPYFRFSNTLLVMYNKIYVYKNPDPNRPVPFFYCWQKYKPNESINLSLRQYNNTPENQHLLGFTPVDSTYFSIIKSVILRNVPPFDTLLIIYRHTRSYSISFTKYHLNEDVYNYYKALNLQIEAKQRVFDPISNQVRGNIICENDPNEPVLGVFEVSSASTRTYLFTDYLSRNYLNFKELIPMDLEKIPNSDCIEFEEPSFWNIFD